MILLLGAGMSVHGSQTNYQYEVKSEQIQTDAGYSGEATALEDLSQPEREAIWKAHKKSDHFLGGSSALIETNEPLNLSQEQRWQSVEIEGVQVLVGIHGPDPVERNTVFGGIGLVSVAIGTSVIVVALMLDRT